MLQLHRTTVFQRIALVFMLLAMVGAIVSRVSGGPSGVSVLIFAFLVFYFAFRKELLWRVRNRLFVTYFLFGVVPVFLAGFMLSLTVELLLGQFATQHVRQKLEARIEIVRSAAQSLEIAASHRAKEDLLNDFRLQVPKLNALVRTDANTLLLPSDSPLKAVPGWISPGFSGLFEVEGKYYIGADAREGNSEALAYLLLDDPALDALTPGVVSVGGILGGEGRTDLSFRPSGSRISVMKNGKPTEIMLSRTGAAWSWWDIPIAGLLAWDAQTSSGKREILIPLASRPSLLIGNAASRMASIIFSLLAITGGVFVMVEAVSLFSSIKLTSVITRSADDLYQGTLKVAEGDFSYCIPVRGKHQLSDLAASFNGMTTRIRQLIGEVKKKEKLDAELEIARQVQLRLFPKSVPKLNTLEMAGVCIPGRVVSGDYYDYVRLDDRWTAIALGDVSGKGVSAALLMASIQSALHAQLKFSGDASHPVLSTATLMALLSQQLYENTPPEKYATFFCSVYDDETGSLAYTNAGHLKPILVRSGHATTLEGGGMVAGLLADVQYEQQDILLQQGDLVAIFSDGIPEAENAAAQEFGEARLAELLVSQIEKPLDTIISTVTTTVEKWIHDPEGRDDLTLVLLRKL